MPRRGGRQGRVHGMEKVGRFGLGDGGPQCNQDCPECRQLLEAAVLGRGSLTDQSFATLGKFESSKDNPRWRPRVGCGTRQRRSSPRWRPRWRHPTGSKSTRGRTRRQRMPRTSRARGPTRSRPCSAPGLPRALRTRRTSQRGKRANVPAEGGGRTVTGSGRRTSRARSRQRRASGSGVGEGPRGRASRVTGATRARGERRPGVSTRHGRSSASGGAFAATETGSRSQTSRRGCHASGIELARVLVSGCSGRPGSTPGTHV
jgi:hypothetical protein